MRDKPTHYQLKPNPDAIIVGKEIMKTLAYDYYNAQDVEVTITRFHHLIAGYGHKRVFFEIEYNGSKKEFSTLTTDVEFFDNLDEDNYNEWGQLYLDNFYSEISEEVDEWVSDVAEQEETTNE